MEILKKVLVGMVILLVVIVVGGGLYLTSMGGMNHGTTVVLDTTDKQNTDQKADSQSANNTGASSVTQKDASGQQPAGQQPTGQPGSAGAGTAPVIIQLQPPKTDPGVYIEQLKEKLNSINEINSSIASSSGGHDSTARQNGQAESTPQNDMNQLHQNFYKLGKDVATMEQSLEKLSASVRENQVIGPQQSIYTYPYSNPYTNYPNANYQYPNSPYYPNQSSQTLQPNQHGQQPNGTQNQHSSTPGDTGHSGVSDGQINHGFSLGNIINSGSAQTLFTIMLLGSIILAIISVVGFLTSLFKQGTDRTNHTAV